MLTDNQLSHLLESWQTIIMDKVADGYTLSMNVYTSDPELLSFSITLSKEAEKPVSGIVVTLGSEWQK